MKLVFIDYKTIIAMIKIKYLLKGIRRNMKMKKNSPNFRKEQRFYYVQELEENKERKIPLRKIQRKK